MPVDFPALKRIADTLPLKGETTVEFAGKKFNIFYDPVLKGPGYSHPVLDEVIVLVKDSLPPLTKRGIIAHELAESYMILVDGVERKAAHRRALGYEGAYVKQSMRAR